MRHALAERAGNRDRTVVYPLKIVFTLSYCHAIVAVLAKLLALLIEFVSGHRFVLFPRGIVCTGQRVGILHDLQGIFQAVQLTHTLVERDMMRSKSALTSHRELSLSRNQRIGLFLNS